MAMNINVRAAGTRCRVLRTCALGLAMVALCVTGATAKDKIMVGLILPGYSAPPTI